MNPESISPCFTDRRLVAAYEELRRQAMHRQAMQGWRGPGLALMISRGFRCWMEAWSQLLTNEYSRAQQPDTPEPAVTTSARRDIVILLASMLLHRVSKGIV